QGVPAVPDAAPAAGKPPPAVAAVSPPPAAGGGGGGGGGSHVFRPDVLPPEVEAHRAIGALRPAAPAEEQRAALQQLNALAPGLVERREVATVAEAIAVAGRLLPT